MLLLHVLAWFDGKKAHIGGSCTPIILRKYSCTVIALLCVCVRSTVVFGASREKKKVYATLGAGRYRNDHYEGQTRLKTGFYLTDVVFFVPTIIWHTTYGQRTSPSFDQLFVRSSVWNRARIFQQRSAAANGHRSFTLNLAWTRQRSLLASYELKITKSNLTGIPRICRWWSVIMSDFSEVNLCQYLTFFHRNIVTTIRRTNKE